MILRVWHAENGKIDEREDKNKMHSMIACLPGGNRFKADTLRHRDNSPWLLEVRTSFVLKRLGDSWKITLEHSSRIAPLPCLRTANAHYFCGLHEFLTAPPASAPEKKRR